MDRRHKFFSPHRPSMRIRGYALMSLRIFLCFCLFLAVDCQVYITAVNPSEGSLAGGTRMVIRGSGFSSNTMPEGSVVLIGEDYACDPIPLHSTVNQIICKTRPAIRGYFYPPTYFWTRPRVVKVIVDGAQNSTCTPTQGESCTFSYTNGWYVHRDACENDFFEN